MKRIGNLGPIQQEAGIVTLKAIRALEDMIVGLSSRTSTIIRNNETVVIQNTTPSLVTESSTAPVNPAPGQIWIKNPPTPSIVYIRAKYKDTGIYDWLEIGRTT